MIIVPRDGQLRVITQNDHAHFASELLALWRAGGLPRHPRRDQILIAAREHDNGWREPDSAPHCDPETGQPYNFRTIPEDLRRELWRRGARRFRDRDPWVAALIVQHALHLHREQAADSGWRELFDEWRRRREKLLDQCDAGTEELELDYAWVELSDTLSLGLCERWRRSFGRPGLQVRIDRDVVRLEPLSLAGATTFRLPCRWIPERRYSGDSDLAVELASARWQEAEVRILPRAT